MVVLQTFNGILNIRNHVHGSYKNTTHKKKKMNCSEWVFYYLPQKQQILNTQIWDEYILNKNQKITDLIVKNPCKTATFIRLHTVY
jgi:hypothetical protein